MHFEVTSFIGRLHFCCSQGAGVVIKCLFQGLNLPEVTLASKLLLL